MADFLGTSIKYYVALSGGASGGSSAGRPTGVGFVGPQKEKAEFAEQQKDVIELCKRRFFYRPAFDIYGGVGGFFTYGPPGCAMKTNLIKQWRNHFVIEEGLLEIEDTCIMQHQVLKASGHVERFNDFMVKDVVDESKFFRADKLLEDVMEKKLEEPGLTEAQRQEYTIVRNQADGISREEMAAVFQKYSIKSPDTGNDLSDPYEFNLMFPTPIGPGGYLQGYLRPETAQGIFLNFKFCLEQNNNRLPFGVAQIGRSFRNEIAPRAGLTRQREFTQAEIEFFINPKNKAHPKFQAIAGTTLTLFPSPQQLSAQEPVRMTVGEAVSNGTINNETLGYYITRTFMFLRNSGIADAYLRFRQHLPTEMAHYACDCWDAEIWCSYGWLECVGIADRSAFDLNAHAVAAKCDLDYREPLEKPIETEVLGLTKKAEISVMKAMKKDGKAVKEHLLSLDQAALKAIDEQMKGGAKAITCHIDGKDLEVPTESIVLEIRKEKITVSAFTPGVIEPSFGIDRIFTSILEHSYYTRPKEEGSEETNTRGVLALAPSVAPYKCTILPLDQRIARHEKYVDMTTTFRRDLSSRGLSFTTDESGATVGRRYARNDELGIPFAITVDFQTLEDGTVTLRERDSMVQIRLPLTDVAELVRELCEAEANWAETTSRFAKVGAAPREGADVTGAAPKAAAKKEESAPKKEASAKKGASPKASPKNAPAIAPQGGAVDEAALKAIGDELRVLKEKLKGEGITGKKLNDHPEVKALVDRLAEAKKGGAAPPAGEKEPAPKKEASAKKGTSPKTAPKNSPATAPQSGAVDEAALKAIGDELRVLKEKLKGEGITGKKLNEHPEVKALVDKLAEAKKGCAAPPAKAAPAGGDEERKKKLKKVIKEGGKRGVEIEGAADMGGLRFFSTSVDEPEGDLDMLLESMKAMNNQPDPLDEERKGCSGHVGKTIFSAGTEQLAIVSYVPKEEQANLNCKEWLQAVLANFGGEIVSEAADICVGRVLADGNNNVFPLKIREPMILEANNFLRKKGLFPEDDSDDDEMVFGDDDFPS